MLDERTNKRNWVVERSRLAQRLPLFRPDKEFLFLCMGRFFNRNVRRRGPDFELSPSDVCECFVECDTFI